MIEIVRADGSAERARLAAMRARAQEKGARIDKAVADIMRDVKENGFAAVCEYSRRFDKAEPSEIGGEELEMAYYSCSKKLIAALERSAANIRAYNEKLLAKTLEWTSPDGGTVGRVVHSKVLASNFSL